MAHEKKEERNPRQFRDYVGVLTAFICVMAFVAIGFLQIGLTVFRGVPVIIPGDWQAAMLSLSSAALGYLIGNSKLVETIGGMVGINSAGAYYPPGTDPSADPYAACPNPSCPMKQQLGQ